MDYKEEFQKYIPEQIKTINDLKHKGNNRLFEVETFSSRLLLKKYSDRVPSSIKTQEILGRGTTEFNTLTYLWDKGFREVPQPISFFPEDNLGVYTYESGKTLKPSEVSKEDIEAMVDFVVKINNLNKSKEDFHLATSACLNLQEYIEIINRRVSAIVDYQPEGEIGERARRFLDLKVFPKLRQLKEDFYAEEKVSELNQDIPLEYQVLNPADFGFHNTLVNKGSDGKKEYKFIDFEYFGIDDPVRQTLEFLHHATNYELPHELKQHFLDYYKSQRKPYAGFDKRLMTADPLGGMTWTLIYLNVLSKSYLEKIKQNHGDLGNIIEERLSQAEKKLENLREIK